MNEFEFCITIGNEIVINLLKKYYVDNYKEITDKNFIKEIEKHYKDLLKLYNKILYFIENKNNKIKINNDEVYEVFLKLSILINENNIDLDIMKKNYDLRVNHGNDNGALYFKQLLEKQLVEYKTLSSETDKIESQLYEKYNMMKLEFENAIQESESAEKMEELLIFEKKITELIGKRKKIEDIINNLEKQLKEKWHYEIYGTFNYKDLEK